MRTENNKSPMMQLLTNRNFWIAFLIQLVYTVGNVCVKQTVTLQADNLGLSASIIGVIASCYTIFAMICRTPFGQAMDRFDKKKILMLTFVGRALVFVGFGLVKSVPLFIVLRILHGALFGMGHIAMMIVLAAGGNRKALGAALGLLTLLPKLVSSYTTNLALKICDTVGTNAACYAGAACNVICIVLCLLLVFNDAPAKAKAPAAGLKNYMNWRAVPLILICTFVSVPSLFIDNFMVLYGKAVPEVADMARAYLTSYMWWMGIGAFVAGYAFDKFGFKLCTYPCIVMGIVAQLMLGFSVNPTVLSASAILCGLACGGIAVTVRTHAVNESPVAVAALTVATTGLFQDLSSLLGSSFGGFLIDGIGFSGTFKIVIVFPVIALVMMFFYPQIMNCLKGQTTAASENA